MMTKGFKILSSTHLQGYGKIGLLIKIFLKHITLDLNQTSDLSDTEDELEKTKTTSALSDGSDLINTSSDSEFDLDFNPDPKPWKNLKPELQSVLPESDMYTYFVECYYCQSTSFVVPQSPILRYMFKLIWMMKLKPRIGWIVYLRRQSVRRGFLILISPLSNV